MSRSEINLYNIFKGITPQAIQDIPLVATAMRIFTENLEKNAQISKRISAIFDYDETTADTAHLKNAKKKLKTGLYMMYISTLYKAIEKMSQDIRIQKTLKKFLYTDAGVYKNITNIVNNEFFGSYRAFAQMVGTKRAIHYMYCFAKYLETGSYTDDLIIDEKVPFLIRYEGSLNKDIFEKIVYPLVHPLGWAYSYDTIISEAIKDYYGIIQYVILNKLELYNSKNYKYVVFTNKTLQDVIDDFLTRTNPKTLTTFTYAEILEQVTVFVNKDIEDYSRWTDTSGFYHRLYTFKDETVLYYDASTSIIYYTTQYDYLDGIVNPIAKYSADYRIDAELASDITFEYYDEIEEYIKEVNLTRYLEEPQRGIGDTLVKLENIDEMFKVTGDVMRFYQGLDEGITIASEYGQAEGFNKFIEFTDAQSGDIVLYDTKFEEDTLTFNNQYTQSFDSVDYHGKWLTIEYDHNEVWKDVFGFETSLLDYKTFGESSFTSASYEKTHLKHAQDILNVEKKVWIDKYNYEYITYQKGAFGFETSDNMWETFNNGYLAASNATATATDTLMFVTVSGHFAENIHATRNDIPEKFQNTLPTLIKYNSGMFGFDVRTDESQINPYETMSNGVFYNEISDNVIHPIETDETETSENSVLVTISDGTGRTLSQFAYVDEDTKTFKTHRFNITEFKAGTFELSALHGNLENNSDYTAIRGNYFKLTGSNVVLPVYKNLSRGTRTYAYYEDMIDNPAIWLTYYKNVPSDADLSDILTWQPKRFKTFDEDGQTITKYRVGTMIGELYNVETLEFAEPDKWSADYIKNIDPLEFDEYIYKKDGLIIEGNDYNLLMDDYPAEVCFIAHGFNKQYFESTDNFLVDQTYNVVDDVTVETI